MIRLLRAEVEVVGILTEIKIGTKETGKRKTVQRLKLRRSLKLCVHLGRSPLTFDDDDDDDDDEMMMMMVRFEPETPSCHNKSQQCGQTLATCSMLLLTMLRFGAF